MMTDSPPTGPDADTAARSVQEQLDELLAQIETEEPGTVDREALPAGFASQADPPKGPGTQDASADDLAEAMHDFEQALEADASVAASGDDAPDQDRAQADPPIAEEPQAEVAQTQAQAHADAGEVDMLAALNAALQELNPAAPSSAKPAADAKPEPEPGTPPAKGLDESSLQDEISALLSAAPQAAEPQDEPQADAPAEPQAEAATSLADPPAHSAPPDAEQARGSTEDQIAAEIESLLATDGTGQAGDGAAGEAPQPTGNSADGSGDIPADETSIDVLDQLLAEEIDDDEELAGDFQSVHAITAGIDTGQADADTSSDEHAATARDVAAELDNQPEDNADDPLDIDLDAIAANASRNAEALGDESDHDRAKGDWPAKLAGAKGLLLNVCFAINWPARRFLTREWRANLGYIALINLFVGVAIWLYLIIR